MLYDASRVGNAEPAWFERGWWARRGEVSDSAEGRGAAAFINVDGRLLLLRQYRRGGAIARLSTDQYFWRSADSTRSFVEWHMLYVMRRAGLPVPVPLAACYRRVGRFGYRAWLLLEQIEDVVSLGARLRAGPLPLLSWIAVGRCLRRFHEDGVYHADLNAHNILLRGDEDVWLVDFDRGQLRKPGLWCDGNLVRLRRSIEKLTGRLPESHFAESDWASLLDGYFSAAPPGVADPIA